MHGEGPKGERFRHDHWSERVRTLGLDQTGAKNIHTDINAEFFVSCIQTFLAGIRD